MQPVILIGHSAAAARRGRSKRQRRRGRAPNARGSRRRSGKVWGGDVSLRGEGSGKGACPLPRKKSTLKRKVASFVHFCVTSYSSTIHDERQNSFPDHGRGKETHVPPPNTPLVRGMGLRVFLRIFRAIRGSAFTLLSAITQQRIKIEQ